MSNALRRRHQAGLQRADADADANLVRVIERDRDNNINNNTVNEDNFSSTRPQATRIGIGIGIGVFQISRVYILVSVMTVLLAIILAPIKIEYPWMSMIKIHNDIDTFTIGDNTGIVTKSFENAIMGIAASSQNRGMETKDGDEKEWNKRKQQQRRRRHVPLLEKYNTIQENKLIREIEPLAVMNKDDNVRLSWFEYWTRKGISTQRIVWWTTFLNSITDTTSEGGENVFGNNNEQYRGGNDDTLDTPPNKHKQTKYDNEWQWIDPVFFHSHSITYIVTNIFDKILKSTIRMCITTNFMLAMICLVHSAIAAWFLSYSRSSSNNEQQQQGQYQEVRPVALVTDWASGARERMVGFLVFKLLLISAVVEPDYLEFLILVMWYTLLGCLRSLDRLAHSTNSHLTAIGRPPKNTGVVQLLFWVLACDIVAACSCYIVFHTVGWDMVLLLTCDCAFLGSDTMGHILKYYQCFLEDYHDANIRKLEVRQLELHDANENNNSDDDIADYHQEDPEDSFEVPGEGERQMPVISTMTPAEIRQESKRLDRRIEGLELKKNRYISILDSTIFYLEISCNILTVAHFCHIWSLYGIQFTLIDGVLALHLHSAISTACTKLARRRSIHSIYRNLQGQFPNATDEELRKASISGDVCCICLGTMSTGVNVKKITCGHLFHTHCLREVIEREQNLQAIKCPLCRAPLVDNPHLDVTVSPTNNIHNDSNIAIQERNIPLVSPVAVEQEANNVAAIERAVTARQVGRERALFRFSTEGILPIWLFPAFSFEVIRRPALGAQVAAHIQHNQIDTIPIDPVATPPTLNQQELNSELENSNQIHQHQEEQQEAQLSFIQRLLILTGAMPMSPEEEARALAQLVDMFPQYNRHDLSRELIDRGSPEAVTEAILMGVFPGDLRAE
mmetsp:Transcript_45225/g.50689  ORF Transcript_45225/g.50689 Transcript_45225/m.50689 type:complete len:905 (-) Transcript_45225:1856-4570(-)